MGGSFELYEHDERRGFVGGGHIAAAGGGIPLPINWRLPRSPSWAAAKDIDRLYFNHGMAVVIVVHGMPRHENRIELDDAVADAWGLPVARVTPAPHENDLAMGRFLIDRNAEILEAAGANRIQNVYIDRITGSCSHQHGTARMGDDPQSSVVDRFCRALIPVTARAFDDFASSGTDLAPVARHGVCSVAVARPVRAGLGHRCWR